MSKANFLCSKVLVRSSTTFYYTYDIEVIFPYRVTMPLEGTDFLLYRLGMNFPVLPFKDFLQGLAPSTFLPNQL